VREPDEALALARRRAAEAPDHDVEAPWRLDDVAVSTRRLAEWAMIEPERIELYSTRRFGRPLTVVKRLLVRFLSQYFNELAAQQSRFNAQVTAHVVSLDERVRALEERARADRPE
jgi:hypothetical protein